MEEILIDMKSLGQIGYEEYRKAFLMLGAPTWIFLTQPERDAWEQTAEAVVNEHENRKPDPEEPEEI